MESLLPSEIARLVYGYLIDEKCESAAEVFLNTSEFLKECNVALQRGRKFNTRVMGLCLIDILNLYTDAVCLLRNFCHKGEPSTEDLTNVIHELQRVLLIDESNAKNSSKTVFLRISIPPKKSGNQEKNEAQDKEMERGASKKEEKKETNSPEDMSIASISPGKSCGPVMDEFDLNMLQTLLDNTTLHERLAENINKAIDSSGEVIDSKQEEKKIVETVLHTTEADPIFDELIHMLAVPRQEDTTTPEDTDKENGDPTEEEKLNHAETTASQEQETALRLDAESNLAIEGILDSNKKIQEDNAAPESQPNTQSPDISGTMTPNITSSILVPLTTSTPLQPVNSSNIPFLGFISPVQTTRPITRVLTKVATVTSSGITHLRKRITPRTEESSSPLPIIHIPDVPEPLKGPFVRTRGGISRKTGSRGRGVKAITPKVLKANTGKINIVFAEATKPKPKKGRRGPKSNKKKELQGPLPTIEEIPASAEESVLTNDTSIVVLAPQNEDEVTEKPQQEECSHVCEVVQHDSLMTSENTQADKPPELSNESLPNLSLPDIEPCENVFNQENSDNSKQKVGETIENESADFHDKSLPNVERAKEIEEGTPENHTSIPSFKPRVSLSTPRRGSHVRVLDFKTPDKSISENRRSLTSPKMYPKSKLLDNVDNVKRGIFNSPDTRKDTDKKSDWDADLRMFLSSDNMDIPTSVGLKRKNMPPKETKNRRKGGKPVKITDSDKATGTPVKSLSSSNEELVKQIEKEVKDAIGDDELSLDSSRAIVTPNLIPSKANVFENDSKDKLASEGKVLNNALNNSLSDREKSDKENSQDSALESSTNASRSMRKTCSIKETASSTTEINPAENSMNNKNNNKEKNENVCCISDGNTKINEAEAPSEEQPLSVATPLKLSISPRSDSNQGHITPTTKILMSQLGTSSSSIFSPQQNSYSNLESILITEGNRLEMEKANQVVPETGLLSSDKLPESDEKINNNEVDIIKNIHEEDKQTKIIPLDKTKINILQTPAKPFTAVFPPGTPVDMTPLTKVIHNETRILSTALVTPTLPATPRLRDDRSPEQHRSLDNEKEQREETDNSNTKAASSQLSTLSPLEQNQSTEEVSTKHLNNTTKDNENDPQSQSTKTNESITTASAPCGSISRRKQVASKLSKTPRIKLLPKKNEMKDYLSPLPSKEPLKPIKLYKTSTASSSSESTTADKQNCTPKKTLSKRKSNDKITLLPSPTAKEPQFIKTSTPKSKKAKVQLAQNTTGKTRKQTVIQKISPNKKTSKFQLELMQAEEIVLNECLQKAKAQLFGVDSSSSDSSDGEASPLKESTSGNNSKRNSSNNSVKEQEFVHSKLSTARERLQHLEKLSMLESSSSSDSLIDISTNSKSTVFQTDRISNALNKTATTSFPLKTSQTKLAPATKIDLSSTSETKRVSPPLKCDKSLVINETPAFNSKEKEDSCESFPTLYLSEESNASMLSEAHTMKSMKFRKSPSSVSDLFLRKSINPDLTSTNITVGEKKPSAQLKVSPQSENLSHGHASVTSNIKYQTVAPIPQKTLKGLDSYETVIHQSSSKITSLSDRERRSMTEYLNDYVYSFTFEDRDNLLCKTLHTSPFYTIFELNSKYIPHSENKNKTSEKSEKPKNFSPRERKRKRRRSESSSDDEKRNFGRFRRGTRREFRDSRPKPPPSRRRRNYSPLKSKYYPSPHYRSYHGRPNYSMKRPRPEFRESILKNRSSERDEKRPLKRSVNELQESCSTSKSLYTVHHKFETKNNFNDSFRSSKSSESDRLQVDKSFRCSDQSASPINSSAELLNTSVNERTQMKIIKENFHFSRGEDREDGELSDSTDILPTDKSSSQLAAAEAKRKEIINLVSDQSRASLLEKVDLDRFLTLLHGEEK